MVGNRPNIVVMEIGAAAQVMASRQLCVGMTMKMKGSQMMLPPMMVTLEMRTSEFVAAASFRR